MSANTTTPSGSMDDTFVISDSDITIDLGNYSSGNYTIGNIDTITLGGSSSNFGSSVIWSDNSYNTNYSYSPVSHNVEIDTNGVKIKEDADLKIGERSLKDFMDKVEDQLAILRPAPELEEKWDQLKDLRRQYEALKQDILEKEKIMKILKED